MAVLLVSGGGAWLLAEAHWATAISALAFYLRVFLRGLVFGYRTPRRGPESCSRPSHKACLTKRVLKLIDLNEYLT